jgi:hypothetical protein
MPLAEIVSVGESSTARENSTAKDELPAVDDATINDTLMADVGSIEEDSQAENICTFADLVQDIQQNAMDVDHEGKSTSNLPILEIRLTILSAMHSDDFIDEALGMLSTSDNWLPVNPTIDKLWDDFVSAEVRESGLPIPMLVKPSGHGPIVFALNYATENETAFQEYGVTADPSQPCIRVMATKMGIPLDDASLLSSGLWTELCYRRAVVPPRGSKEGGGGAMPYDIFGADVLSLHRDFRLALWNSCNNPLALLLGKPSFEWYKKNIRCIAIPFSKSKIFKEQAKLRVETDEEGNIVRLALPVLHPSTAFYSLENDTAGLNDMTWNFVLACAGISSYNATYFQYRNSLKQDKRRDEIDSEIKVNWGAMGTDLVAFVKATRKYETATKEIVPLSEFPQHVRDILKERSIKLTGFAHELSPSQVLAQELWRQGVATKKELDYPNLMNARVARVKAWAVRTNAGNARVLAYEQQHGGFHESVRKKQIEADKQDLANGVAPEVIAGRVAERKCGRRMHVTAQEVRISGSRLFPTQRISRSSASRECPMVSGSLICIFVTTLKYKPTSHSSYRELELSG